MLYEKGGLIRQNQMLIEFVTRGILGRQSAELHTTDELLTPEDAAFHKELLGLLDDRQINQAENRLFEEFDPQSTSHLTIALDFYQRLNDLDDVTLEALNYSREELQEGLLEILKLAGVETYGL